jgi:deoxyribonuclease IV
MSWYSKKDASECLTQAQQAVSQLMGDIESNGWDVELAPETMGKLSQFGSLDEILSLAQSTGCHYTIDFSHVFARAKGNVEFIPIVKRLGRRIHAHVSGIEWGEKGERRHLPLEPSFFKPIAEALVLSASDVTLISETPEPLQGATMMLSLLKDMGRRT